MRKTPTGKGRRTLKRFIPNKDGTQEKFLPAQEIYKMLTAKTWDYKIDVERYHARDKALMAIDFVGAFRNNEPLKTLRKNNFEDRGNWLYLVGARISKRSEKLLEKMGPGITIRPEIGFPKFKHTLQPFTDLVLDYLDLLEPDEVLFPFGEVRHYQIVRKITGKWVHWLRAQGENWFGHNVFINDPVQLAKYVGVVNVQSVMGYTGFDQQSYIECMKRASLTDRK